MNTFRYLSIDLSKANILPKKTNLLESHLLSKGALWKTSFGLFYINKFLRLFIFLYIFREKRENKYIFRIKLSVLTSRAPESRPLLILVGFDLRFITVTWRKQPVHWPMVIISGLSALSIHSSTFIWHWNAIITIFPFSL